MSEELREAARLSPDGALVAVRRGPNDWRVSNGGHYRDVHVADWTPLTPLPELAALIADAERVVLVRSLLWFAEKGGEETVSARELRRALDGDQ